MIDLLDIPYRISQLLGESHEAPTAIRSVSRTDRGDRLTNDDRCFRDDNKGIYLLVDGIGGHAGGRLASMIATATITKSLEDDSSPPEGCDALNECLHVAVSKSCQSMQRLGKVDPKYEHMGCTFALAVLRGSTLHFTSVGCVRIYLFRNGKLQQLTEDDSLVQGLVKAHAVTPNDARRHCWRNIITNSLTAKGFIHEPDWKSVEIEAGDQLLLATNGINNSLSWSGIEDVLGETVSLDSKVDHLLESARESESLHNASCILISADSE